MKFDEIDIAIIKRLQQDARTSISQMSAELGLSVNSVSVRYKKIKKSGLIKRTFIPTFLPQYVNLKKFVYRMQIAIRATNTQTKDIIEFIQSLEIEHAQIECWETIGHFNVLVWIISEDPIDAHVMQGKIESQVGIIETKASVVTNICRNPDIDLSHLIGRRTDG